MSVVVPGSVSGSLVSEYAATNITINRQIIKDQNGFLTSVFNANIAYEKKTYVLDINNKKIGIVIEQENNPSMPVMPGSDRGNLSLDYASFAQYFSKTCSEGEILGELVANLADELIHQDLVNRGILNA